MIATVPLKVIVAISLASILLLLPIPFQAIEVDKSPLLQLLFMMLKQPTLMVAPQMKMLLIR
jgi:hypothetical protein